MTIADGNCIIDIGFVRDIGNSDLETYKEIGRIAELIIFELVVGPGDVRHGEIASGFGKTGGDFPY